MTVYEFVFLLLALFFILVFVFAWWMDERPR
jgi:hypothetical protein